MAISSTPVRLCAPTALTGTEATLYTAPTGTGLEAVIRNIHIVNTAAADRTLRMSIGAYAAGTALFTDLTVPANDAMSLDVYIGLNSAETLRASAPSSGLTVTVMGVE